MSSSISRTARIILPLGALALLALSPAPALAQPAAPPSAPPKLKDEHRMPWSRDDTWFLRTWLVAGPFNGSLDDDGLAASGGEAAARPASGAEAKRSDGGVVRWKAHTAWGDAVGLDDALSLPSADSGVAYAFTTLKRASAGEALLAIGSDDGIRVFLNGQLVHRADGPRPLVFDEDRVPVEVQAGDNALLVKVEQRRGRWDFSLRVLEKGTRLAPSTEIGPAVLEEESSPVALVVRTDVRKPDPGGADVTVEVVAPGGTVVASGRASRGQTLRLLAAAWPDGPYDVRFTTKTADGRAWVTHEAWFKGDARASARAVVAKGKGVDATTAAGRTRQVLAELVLDRVNGDVETAGPEALRRTYSAQMESAELDLEAAGKTGRVRAFGFVRLAWVDDVDGSVQFCRAYLPPGYDPGRRRPLIVNLHGYNPANPVYVRWWNVDLRHHAIHSVVRGEDDPILVEPHGRGNTSYEGMGEKDVLRAIAEAKKAFAVDEDRVYLMGDSMGGGGTWYVGTRHPDVFAAIAPIYGGFDYHGMFDEAMLAALSPTERVLWERRSSFAQAEGALNLPILVTHGDSDKSVPVEFSRWVVRMLQRWGYDVSYHELPGRGHEDMKVQPGVWEWLLPHRRVAFPRHVRLRSAELPVARAYWVALERRERELEFLEADAEVIGANRIRFDTRNVARATLRPGPLVDPARPVEVLWNGAPRTERLVDGRIELTAEKGPAAPTLAKTPQQDGGFGRLFQTPFAVVVGTTASDPGTRKMIEGKARGFVDGWRTAQKTTPRVFNDTELRDADAARYSLLLFGGPAENAVTKRFASKLPVEVRGSTVVVGGRSFEARDAGVAFVYPSPLAPERYVGVVAGTSPSGVWFVDPNDQTLWDWDFAIVDGRTASATAAAPPGYFFERGRVASGQFDPAWQADETLVAPGDAALRSAAKPLEPPRPVAIAPLALDALTGTYSIPDGPTIRIWRDGARLIGSQDGQDGADLLTESESVAVVLAQPIRLVFEKGANGKATGMVVKVNGQDVPARRID